MKVEIPWSGREGRTAPTLITLVGAFLFTFTGLMWVLFPSRILNGGIVRVLPELLFNALPALGLAYGGQWLRKSDLDPARFRRIASWCVGGLALLVVVNLGLQLSMPPNSLSEAVGWIHGVSIFGSVGGFAIGVVEARAIERAREAERERAKAEQAEQERERLDYLNALLRHEALNTATVIEGQAALTIEEADLAGEIEDRIGRIKRQSTELTRLIDDAQVLVAATQSEELVPVELGTVLTEQVDALRDAHDPIDVAVSVPEDAYVLADDLLGRVFGNLLKNAAKHTDAAEPRIRIDADVTGDTISVRVEDDGPGIPAGERETLFERSDSDRTHGLGMYITNTLVQRYGGSIELVETGPEGTVFLVELQRAEIDERSVEKANNAVSRGLRLTA